MHGPVEFPVLMSKEQNKRCYHCHTIGHITAQCLKKVRLGKKKAKKTLVEHISNDSIVSKLCNSTKALDLPARVILMYKEEWTPQVCSSCRTPNTQSLSACYMNSVIIADPLDHMGSIMLTPAMEALWTKSCTMSQSMRLTMTCSGRTTTR